MDDDWQPIDSAPRDSTWLLLCGFGFVRAGYWDATFEYDPDRDDDSRPLSGMRGAWTDDTVASWAYQERHELRPTHWRPLPPPPKESADDR